MATRIAQKRGRDHSRIRTGVDRFAGGSLTTRACGRAVLAVYAKRALGWTRTSGLQARDLVLSPLSYEGVHPPRTVQADGFQPPERDCRWVTNNFDSSTS